MEDFINQWRPGSRGSDWTWNDEFHDLMTNDREYMLDLIEDIKANGIQKPVLLGDDRRVWDGHHRVVAALAIGMKQIPIELAVARSPF